MSECRTGGGEFQVMGPLDEDEYQSLKADIDENGVEVPVVLDENGTIIDGYHRVQACEELGIEEYPTDVREGLSHGEKIDLAYKLNAQRRNLDGDGKLAVAKSYLRNHYDKQEQRLSDVARITGASNATVTRAKKALADGGVVKFSDENFTSQGEKHQAVREAIEDDPDASNREIAERTGISHPTVGAVRGAIEDPGDPVPTGGGDSGPDDSEETLPGQQPVGTDGGTDTLTDTGETDTLTDTPSTTPTSTPTDGPSPSGGEETQPSEHEREAGVASEGGEGGSATPAENSVGVFTSQQTDEWSSPRRIVEPLADVLDGFDLDPCSGAERSPFAATTYTDAENGLENDWFGDVWVNPPYSEMSEWVEKAVAETQRDSGPEHVLFLCKGDGSTQWYNAAARNTTGVCRIRGRLSFGDGDNSAPFPSDLFLFGELTDGVHRVLDDLGNYAEWRRYDG